jgi:phosphatidyl-myo-inositol dimannoside synthase
MDSTVVDEERRATRPRLLIVTPDFPPASGGIQVVAHRLAAQMSAFETLVVAPDADGASAYDADSGVRVRRLDPGSHGPRAARAAALNAGALLVGARFRPAITLSAHILASPAASAIRRLLGARTVQYFHAEEIGAKPRLASFAAREADLSIAVSSYTAGLLAAAGAPAGRIRVLANGADVPVEATPLPVERPTVVTVARIEERYKGHDVMVRALPLVLAKVPDAQWVVVGEGSLRPAIEALASTYRVTDAIRFLGAVPDHERDEWLRRAHVFAMPSRLPAGGLAGEGFGIVYLEAGAFGKPVVAGNVGGSVDAVVDSETGLLVDPLDPVAVAEAIVALLSDSALARRLGAAGRRRAEEHAWPLVAERAQRLLLELLPAATGRVSDGSRATDGSKDAPA